MRPNTLPNNPENMEMSPAIEDGMTDNVMGGYSRADNRQGFCRIEGPRGPEDDVAEALAANPSMGGFVGRAKGSER